MVEVYCPKCGHQFNVQVRAPTGSGSRKGKSLKNLTQNHVQLFHVLRKSGRHLTVHQIQKMLFTAMNGQPLMYETRHGKRYWSYHLCQKTLSLLVGKGLISMTKPQDEHFDWRAGEFLSSPVPTYFLTSDQVANFGLLLKDQKNIIIA